MFPEGTRTGEINYTNFLKRFLDLGFNNADCVNELIDNSIDAGAKNITISLVEETDNAGKVVRYLEIVDDGCGMDTNAFGKYFEMFGDKDDSSLQSLGKKGIGGKVALVTLSKLGTTSVVSKKQGGDLLFANISWDKLNKAGNIYVNQASRLVEDYWDTTLLAEVGYGTIAKIFFDACTYDDLYSLILGNEINDRDIYYTACRNYFRHIEEGLNITFIKQNSINLQTVTAKCKALDPLHLSKITEPAYKGEETLRLYTNPAANNRVEVLVKEGTSWIGYRQNKLCSHKMDNWRQEEMDSMNLVKELILEHSYIVFEPEKKPKGPETNKEKFILEDIFGSVSFTKDSILKLTGGTHLERNKKETGLLLDPHHKRTGDFSKREFINQSRHRLIFASTSSNDDVIDKVFKTQINKSKVDINELPLVVKKTIEKLNENFALKVFDVVNAPEASSILQAATVTPDRGQKVAGEPFKRLEQVQTKTTDTVKQKQQVETKNQTVVTSQATPTYVRRAEPMQIVISHPLARDKAASTTIRNTPSEFSAKVDEQPKIASGMSEQDLLMQIVQISNIIQNKDINKLKAICSSECQQELASVSRQLSSLYQKLNNA